MLHQISDQVSKCYRYSPKYLFYYCMRWKSRNSPEEPGYEARYNHEIMYTLKCCSYFSPLYALTTCQVENSSRVYVVKWKVSLYHWSSLYDQSAEMERDVSLSVRTTPLKSLVTDERPKSKLSMTILHVSKWINVQWNFEYLWNMDISQCEMSDWHFTLSVAPRQDWWKLFFIAHARTLLKHASSP